MADVIFDKELRRLAKQANQRMVRLERKGYESPAYQAAQAQLEMLGRRGKGTTGRRFSETGKGTYNQIERMKSILNRFLSQQTSQVAGYQKYRNDVLNSAKERYNFDELGITKDEYMKIWEELPDNEKDRLYGSDDIVMMTATYIRENRDLKQEQRYSIGEIIDIIQSSRSKKEAYRKLGIDYKDISKSRKISQIDYNAQVEKEKSTLRKTKFGR